MNTAIHLARTNKVYYVENPRTIKDAFFHFFDKQKKKITKNEPFITDKTSSENLVIITPPITLSLNFVPEGWFYRQLLKINDWHLSRFIRNRLKKDHVSEFIFINSFNFHYPSVGSRLKPLLNIYQCVDPIIMDFDIKHGHVSETQLHHECDLIFCTSKALYKEKKQFNENTHFIPNAADLSLFSKAMEATTPLHHKITKTERPVVGYVGTIERRFDYDLLKALFAANEDKDFVFAGPVYDEFVPDWFFKVPNLKLIGSIPYNELPSLIKGFDVCLIPFKSDEVSRTIFPLKLFEFLGTGKPVVSTNFNPDLAEFTENAIIYCQDPHELTDALDRSIRTGDHHITERIAVAQRNTWENRAAQMLDIMHEAMENKGKN